jgi:hypothetical protein
MEVNQFGATQYGTRESRKQIIIDIMTHDRVNWFKIKHSPAH